jgi:hypothetical protein
MAAAVGPLPRAAGWRDVALAGRIPHAPKECGGPGRGRGFGRYGRAEDAPIYRHYLGLLDGGTKPNLAKLTIARLIASIALALWRTEEAYDPK